MSTDRVSIPVAFRVVTLNYIVSEPSSWHHTAASNSLPSDGELILIQGRTRRGEAEHERHIVAEVTAVRRSVMAPSDRATIATYLRKVRFRIVAIIAFMKTSAER